MKPFLRKIACAAFALAWTSAVALGGYEMWRYDGAPGIAAAPPAALPGRTAFSANQKLPTLLMFVHPKCPCSRASIHELSRLMTVCHDKVNATVLFVLPPGQPAGWERTDLWTSAAAIPGVRVLVDDAGKQAAQFASDTSGQTILYAADGRLLFYGGITESRGHSGDNDGESDIISLLMEDHPAAHTSPVHTPVYGCSLSTPADACIVRGGKE